MLRDIKGFTLIEMMLALSVFIFVAAFVLQSFVFLSGKMGGKGGIDNKEWEIFLSQAKSEIWQSSSRKTEQGKLYLVIGTDVVLIEKYQNMLRRRLNNTGHEIMLQNVYGFDVEWNGSLVNMTVRDKYGKEFQCSIRPILFAGAGNGT
ncbi:competence type IV pilus minor pilin ComGF [Peribacillus sp. SCS-155]|uniref:competence type IV pilus minor pilin ComGF n=1 Tax=Peribacillus sedimenti TaxID=3115297 RepID=UPI003906433E